MEEGWTLATWVAAISALISLVGACFVAYARWRDRPEAMMHFGLDALVVPPHRMVNFVRDGHPPHRDVRVTNAGDGAAFGVVALGRGCDVQIFELAADDQRGFSTPALIGRLSPDESLQIMVWPHRAPEHPNRLAADTVDVVVQ